MKLLVASSLLVICLLSGIARTAQIELIAYERPFPDTNMVSLNMLGAIEPNTAYKVEVSSNLVTWTECGSITPVDSTILKEPAVGLIDSRIYDRAFFRLKKSMNLSVSTPTTNHMTAPAGTTCAVTSYDVESSSDMDMYLISLDFDCRLWLYADKIEITDEDGHTVASSTQLSASTFAEIVVGTDYRLTMTTVGYPLHKGVKSGFTVNIEFPPSDHQSRLIGLIQAQFKATDTKGIVNVGTTSEPCSFFYDNGH